MVSLIFIRMFNMINIMMITILIVMMVVMMMMIMVMILVMIMIMCQPGQEVLQLHVHIFWAVCLTVLEVKSLYTICSALSVYTVQCTLYTVWSTL